MSPARTQARGKMSWLNVIIVASAPVWSRQPSAVSPLCRLLICLETARDVSDEKTNPPWSACEDRVAVDATRTA
jgi:hypothetical protein